MQSQVSGFVNIPSPTNTWSTPVQAARERDPNCIENMLSEIEVALGESVNSSENLADKLRGSAKTPDAQTAPAPVDINSRLNKILNMARTVNQELGRAHSAISG